MISSFAVTACTPETPEAPVDAPIHASGGVTVCVGTGQVDVGADGTVETQITHRIGDGWNEQIEAVVDGSETTFLVETFDARGQPLSAEYRVETDGEVVATLSTWLRDDAGLLLEYVVQGTDGLTLHQYYTYDGATLVRMDRYDRFRQEPVLTELYQYDSYGRMVEKHSSSVGLTQYTYFEPGPSLDSRVTQDLDEDGSPEATSVFYHDHHGRQLYRESVFWNGTVTWATYTYGPTRDPTFALIETSGPSSPTARTETRTERDDAGHPLWVDVVDTSTADGVETITSHTQIGWTWACDVPL